MDAPPETENNAQFLRLSRFFTAAGVRVPQVLAADLDKGFLLVTDLGELLYARVYESPQRDIALEAALQALIKIQLTTNPDTIVPPYTRQRLHDELELFQQWLVDGMLNLRLTMQERGLLDQSWALLVDNADAQPKVCVHRDYHSRNLLWGPDRVTGIVDFQDALWGPALYDLASLLRDCYVRFDESEVRRWSERYRSLAAAASIAPASIDSEQFARALDLTAVQRQLKALGIFARLELRDGRASHLVDIGPVLDQLIDMTRQHSEVSALGDWLATRIRPAARAALAQHGVNQCGQ